MADDVSELEAATLHDMEIDRLLLDCVSIDPLSLEEEFVRMPADLAYWNEQYAQAIRDHLYAKHEHDKVRAAVMIELREDASASGAKLTVGDLEARVVLDDRVDASHVALIEAEAHKAHMRCRADAVIAKRDMLQSLGAKIRAEMNDPIVREQHVGSKLAGQR